MPYRLPARGCALGAARGYSPIQITVNNEQSTKIHGTTKVDPQMENKRKGIPTLPRTLYRTIANKSRCGILARSLIKKRDVDRFIDVFTYERSYTSYRNADFARETEDAVVIESEAFGCLVLSGIEQCADHIDRGDKITFLILRDVMCRNADELAQDFEWLGPIRKIYDTDIVAHAMLLCETTPLRESA